MNIINDMRLQGMYHGYARAIADINEITVHGSGGGSSSMALLNWMSSENCERKELYKKGIGLFPYTIDFNGDIYNLMPVNNWYYHSDAGQHDSHTIGIEMMNSGQGNSGKYTNVQYASLFELMSDLCSKYPITDIHSHDANRRMFSNMPQKPCPGMNFNWSQLEEYVTENINKSMLIVRG